MKITFYGHSTFALEMAGLTIVTDPCSVGYPQKPARADVITESHQHFDHNDTTGIACPRVLSTKGEWEIGGVSIATRSAYHDDQGGAKRGENLIFVFQGEGLSVAHLGDLGHVSGVDGLQNIDVLLVPIGGFYTIDTGAAIQVIERVKPRIAIPMHFKTPCLTAISPLRMKRGFARLPALRARNPPPWKSRERTSLPCQAQSCFPGRAGKPHNSGAKRGRVLRKTG